MNVLVIGRGGREHAISRKLSESSQVDTVFVAPGNPGMVDVATRIDILEHEQEKLIAFALENQVKLTVIGPEVPLLEGLADEMVSAGLAVFGPKSRAAEIEGSKSFAKELMKKYDIPTGSYEVFNDYEAASAYVKQQGAPIVIKADGLAAGKGVVVAMTEDEALAALKDMLVGAKFGEASATVVIEEFLAGEEFSLMAFVNGETVIPLEIAQDHKRAYDGDKGPNTGGMGAYSPVPHISAGIVETAIATILVPAAKALVKENRHFCGVLYAGLIVTEQGPKVIEFNARFGDPETQVILPRMKSDLAHVMLEVIAGREPKIEWTDEAMLGVVVAANGYPDAYAKGAELVGIEEVAEAAFVFHAGTALNDQGGFTTNGGRVLLVGSKASDLQSAQKQVYDALTHLKTDEVFYRKDIGYKAITHATIEQ